MKRVLMLVLAVFVALSGMTLAIADSPAKSSLYEEAGEKLKLIHIAAGDPVRGLMPEKVLTREEALVFVLRMMGKHGAASGYAGPQYYSDVPLTHWAAPYIGYATEIKLTSGIGGGKFGLGQVMTAKQMASFMLKSLGYTADWATEDIVGKAAGLGLMNDVSAGGNEELIRGETFLMLRNTLRTPFKGEAVPYSKRIGVTDSYFGLEAAGASASSPAPSPARTEPKLPQPSAPPVSNAPVPTHASTYLYEELSIYFDRNINGVDKSDFKVTVGDRPIPDGAIHVTYSGNRALLRIVGQNLHGKTAVIEMTGIQDLFTNERMESVYRITATFKDYYDLVVVEKKVIDEKTCEVRFTVPVHSIKKENLSIRVDGSPIPDPAYEYGHYGDRLKLIFKEGYYPQNSVEIEYSGLETSAYRKWMEDTKTVLLDFTRFAAVEIPYELNEEVPPVVIEQISGPAEPAIPPTAPGATQPALPSEPAIPPTASGTVGPTSYEPAPDPSAPGSSGCSDAAAAKLLYSAMRSADSASFHFDSLILYLGRDHIEIRSAAGEPIDDFWVENERTDDGKSVVRIGTNGGQSLEFGRIVIRGVTTVDCGVVSEPIEVALYPIVN